YQTGAKSFTALSCDNLPNNGQVLAKVVFQFAQQVLPELASWIKQNTCFPCTMIDRIVPATTDEDRKEIEARLGVRDEAMVVAEPFTQWVVEDHFSDGRPEWEKVGVQLVGEVHAFATITLRLLNAARSTLAYSGYLSGFNYINEVMNDPAFVNMITTYMAREAGETIAEPEGFDVEHYKQ